MPTILVTNDDGINAPALVYLRQALASVGDVIVLAPEGNWSAAGHSKTMHKPLRMWQTTLRDGSEGYTTSGAPSDCVALAMLGGVKKKPDLVVSGINEGYNLGSDITYSGTVAAAIESVIHHTPAIAISTCGTRRAQDNGVQIQIEQIWQLAARVAADLARQVLDRGLPPFTLLNANVPCRPIAEIGGPVLCRLGTRIYEDELIVRDDPRGRPYYWFGGMLPDGVPEPGTDIDAISAGKIAVTPINLDMTDYKTLKSLAKWEFATEVSAASPERLDGEESPEKTAGDHGL